ncbi:MAG: hypothetical protein PWR18_825, partial [Synergistales bacterium]|nr:hypothetical protein [Synergistales bacterium]
MNKNSQRQYQQGIFDPEEATMQDTTPVTCLGMNFENDDARREYFLNLLREGLEELHAKLGDVPFTTVEDAEQRMKSLEKWPMGDEERLRELAEHMRESHRKEPEKDLLQLWKDEVGFPHGKIEDILNLSDPPYYTACPNPFMEKFLYCYGKPYRPEEPYNRKPFATDVSEGKTDPIYKAHSYHTKVPHLAIVPAILHYTKPGDVVLDGFCGSGMTGVAAQWCGSAPEGFRRKIEEEFVKQGFEKPEWGERKAVLNDLSPAATFIAANYNRLFDVDEFARAGKQLLDEVEREIAWMYETLHTDGKTKGRIEYTVWSEVFTCPDCSGDLVFLEEALDKETKRVKDVFTCPHCGSKQTKKNLQRSYETSFDASLGRSIPVPRRVPVLIVYSSKGKRYEKKPGKEDLDRLAQISSMEFPSEIPTS